MKVLFKLLKEKIDSDNQAPIYLLSYWQGQEIKMSTGLKCSLEVLKNKINQSKEVFVFKYWEPQKMRFTKAQEGYFELNLILDKLEQKIKTFIIDYRVQNDEKPSIEQIKNHLKPKKEKQAPVNKKTFWQCADAWIDYAKNKEKKAKNTIDNYITMLNHLKSFEKDTLITLKVNGFTSDIFDRFLEYMCNDFDYHPNTIWTWVKSMKPFFTYCVDNEGMSLHTKHSKLKWSYIETDKTHLLPGELQKLANVYLDNKHLDETRDAFIFACVTSPRFGDLKAFTFDHIIEKHDGTFALKFYPQKSQSMVLKRQKWLEIPLNDIAIKILKKYNWGEMGRLLPMVANQTMNENIKLICKKAGIDTLVERVYYENGVPILRMVKKYTIVSMHTSRHTFGVISAMNNMPVLTIKAIMGHAKLSTTEQYMKIANMYHHTTALNIWNNIGLELKRL